ncbi:PLP-dependent aminotransferase family protein [Sporolactobacillus sp. CQH2019]|uniref:MocR-like pyridoxine biosynthesis transcription factor PdxR n=1 Tax=Sporolactobacillus sp. CQH2019 TaxID=3023512 RepID=UPI0023677C64|nr:PLP-dependent aminotransferase family protein [Sporolactobacillus sp. CQH2019]MDD9149091.1 PLP-dependent aminotransferase family protein [Sporolactobacillus sp. CQH2019]
MENRHSTQVNTVMPELSRANKRPLYIQLFDYFTQEIKTKRLPYGCKLPSKRRLSAYLKVSLNTVDNAYQQLLAEGYVESRPRSGLFVIYRTEHLFPDGEKFRNKYPDTESEPQSDLIDFSHGKVDISHFPFQFFRKYSRWLFTEEGSCFFQNGHFQGLSALRREIAGYLYQSRGVISTPSQIAVGAGTQFLLSRLLSILPGQMPFAMENPGFHRVRSLVRDLGIPMADIPIEADGLAVDQIRRMDAGTVYVTPSHQFPLGMILPVSKRMALIEWANQNNNRWIIEDDYDGEFRYIGRPIPSLQGLDRGRSVIYLGTFSKSLIPSLRVSFMVLPVPLADCYKKRFSLYKQSASSLNQQLIREFMRNGDWEHHLNRMRTLYKQKHQAIIQAIHQYMDKAVAVIGEKAGLHLILQINSRMNEKELIAAALQEGVKVYPTSIYYAAGLKPEHPQILLGFAGLNGDEIGEGIRRLSLAWKK